MKLKAKPLSHKSENTYRFLTFSERLANVNIDVIHRIDRTRSYAEEVDTYFFEGLTKWRDLNLTDHFTAFSKEVSHKSQSFNMLVFHQNAIVESLKTHLSVKNSLANQPLLDLVVRFARDLQTDFYPHFPDFFIIITSLLETQDTEVLEWAFTCLSYLYKYLWRLMVKDMKKIYSLYSKLLAHKKEHIRNFAAESFSFLMRKVPDFDGLFTLMFVDLEQCPQKAKGVGQLIFEMCRGVCNMFHSCTNTALPVALRKLGPSGDGDVALPWDAIKEALDHMAESSANYVAKENFSVLWDSLQTCVKDLLPRLEAGHSNQTSEHIERILFIYHTLVEHRKGAKITKPQSVCELLLQLVHTRGLSCSCCTLLLQVISSFLLAENLDLPASMIQELVKNVFTSGMARDLILSFAKEMFSMKQFEQLFLPSMLQYVEQLFSSEDSVSRLMALELLVRLILVKAQPPTDGSMAFEKYPLIFTGQSGGLYGVDKAQAASVPQLILSLIVVPEDQLLSDLSQIWAALVLLPHLRPLEAASVIPPLTALLNRLLHEVHSEKLGRGGLFVARQALTTLLSFKETALVLSLLPDELVRSIIEKFPTDLSALLLADLYYTRLSLSGCSAQLSHNSLLELYQMLHSNFSSNISKIRLLTLRIMSHFEAELPQTAEGEDSSSTQTVFASCLQAEQVPATVQDYREKLLHLRKLRHDLVQPCLPKGPFHLVPLQYLIAMLFVNFRPLWDAVIDLLASHARDMDNKEFWKVYYEHLEMVAGLAEKELRQEEEDDEGGDQDEGAGSMLGPGTDVISSGDVGVLFLEQLEQADSISDRTDFTNFRSLLWRAMSQFPDRVEPRSRELSPLLLRFIRNEFYPADLLVAPVQNLTKRSHSSTQVTSETEKEDVRMREVEEEEEEVEAEEESQQAEKKMPRRAAAKQLIAHLKVFSKFTNPKALYMEPELQQLYTQLLCHKDQQIQRAALDCLMTYKDPCILPYKENLERLLDDKHFKDEIVHFNISEEGTVVLDMHRPQLIPVLMRVLYGRMRTKVGNKFQGKAATASRSSIVLRFLAGSQPEELAMFIDLLLEPVCHHSQGTCLAAVEKAMAETDTSSVLPLGRQHGLLNVIDVVLHKLGHLIQSYLPKLLQILLCVTASVALLLERREQLKPGCIGPLKNLRRLGLLHIQAFFDNFESYHFTADELDALFHAIVWPQVCRLPSESTYAPTPLLKLIHVWSMNARYFPLLAKQRPNHPECDILLNVLALLSSKNVSPNTASMVMDISENLLNTPDFTPSETETELSVNGCVIPEPAPGSDDTTESLTVGSRLLLPHIPAVLQYLGGVVRNSDRIKKKKFRAQVSKELNILSKISRFVTDKEQSSTLIRLLLPYLHKPKIAEETELDILSTVQNLLRQCSEPSVFLKPLSKLFSIIRSKPCRKVLCEVFKTLSDLDNELKYIVDVAVQLNAFDSRHLDEIHFDVRLMAFQKSIKYIEEMTTLDMRYLMVIMHNCFHSFEIGDMSLADSATLCLSAILARLAAVGCPEQEYKEIVQYTVLDAVRRGLKSKTESVRSDYTSVLACLVKTFPSRSEFRDLVQLTNYTDPESDFFEHMKHIQVHRRGRALRKFAKQLTEGTVVMSSRSMQNFIMPYAMIALFDEKLLKHEAMTSAAVEVIGAVCKRLTWSKYLYYLKHFIHVLQTGMVEQKLAVSLLLIILEAFHFDLESLSKEIKAAKNKKADEPNVLEGEAEEEQAEVMDSDESDTEDAMETNDADALARETDGMDTGEGDSTKPKEATEAKPKRAPPVVSSGLPQSKEELEALISSIHHTVTQSILPRLHKCLIAKVKRDDEHKTVKSKEVKDEEVVRVPIAFAMVRLMQTLPQEVMEANLPGILLKVCVHLKSRFQEIRDVARNTLIKIIEALGHHYLPYLLREMQGVLVKGYQIHVLTFTVYHLLSILRPSLKAGELDPCLDILIEIFNNELFGSLAAEKEIKGIVSKVMEARHSKSSDSYEFLAQFCSQERVTQLILPLKEILEKTASLKVSRRVHSVLRRVVAGLLMNQSMTPQSILLLSHGLVSQSLPLITSKSKQKAAPPPDPRLPPPSCLLLPPTPKRGGEKAAISRQTNMHILVDTGLSLLHGSLKNSKVNSSVASVREMLDPFVSLLLDCLNSMHVKVITESLQAFIWILKFPLPAVEQNADQLTKQLFVLLKDYAKAGAGHGENFHLVQNCFKVITVLVKSVTKNCISDTQLQVLLGYAEEDIYDNSRQATAFGLLKAILSKKLVVPEMEEVMKKVAKLSINGSNEQVRVRCRQIYLKYLMDYPLGKKLRNHFDFIVAQLTYEYDTGRQSALEMMAFIFQTFPQPLLLDHCGLFFVPLSLAMVNDDSARCKKMASLAIKSLLGQLDVKHKNSMFTLVNGWLTGEKVALRRLGAQVCGLFVEAEGEQFGRRLDSLLPLVEREIHTANFEDIEEEENEKAADRLLFYHLVLITKLIKDCGFLELHKPADTLSSIWGHIEAHLRYPHYWVWLTASQIFGLLFAAQKPEELLSLWHSERNAPKNTQPVASSFLSTSLDKKMRELVLSFCHQLQSKFLDITAGEQVIKNLLFVAKVIYLISPESDLEENEKEEVKDAVEKTEEENQDGDEEQDDEEDEQQQQPISEEQDEEEEHQQKKIIEEQEDNRPPSLLWMIKKLTLLAKREAANTPKVPVKRTCVFKFLGAIAVDLGKERLGPYLTTIIAPLFRELDSTYADQDPTLKNLAQELIELLKKLVGLEKFSLAFAAVQKEATQRRASRKKLQALQAVANPDIAARKKIKKHQKKTEAKKRKTEFLRPGHKAKKSKRSSLRDLAMVQ
ncbi:small subunit processome component 20 homolog [Pangasianodon hypophthalmus]|uniref:small subunit processome component 20 homolog n=1 Tax=Pangasianodon hypophthalmus TaxID=310915 RepID=UPI0023070FBC|nr:small subunit processome component 20 homolog [Pangasianodon hypophthalmus]